jgi:hypothetical protein
MMKSKINVEWDAMSENLYPYISDLYAIIIFKRIVIIYSVIVYIK